jgi:ABC-type branched-subunit amino acid transport system substrate-binding protein
MVRIIALLIIVIGVAISYFGSYFNFSSLLIRLSDAIIALLGIAINIPISPTFPPSLRRFLQTMTDSIVALTEQLITRLAGPFLILLGSPITFISIVIHNIPFTIVGCVTILVGILWLVITLLYSRTGSGSPSTSHQRTFEGFSWLLIIELCLFTVSTIICFPRYNRDPSIIPAPLPLLSSCTQSNLPNKLVTKQAGTAEYTGISNGSFAFDVAKTRLDFDLKCKGARAFLASKLDEARSYWRKAAQIDTNDAELHIYQEDLNVLQSGRPYITFVVGSILTGDADSIGRDFLQGTYVAQYLHNLNNRSLQVNLLVANFGSIARQYTDTGQPLPVEMTIVKQMVQFVRNDTSLHIKGIVLGLPFIANGMIQLFDQSGVPVVLSDSFSQAQLQGTTNIFPVAASTDREGLVGAAYVANNFPKSKIAVFVDKNDPYSQSLATSFAQRFPASAIVLEPYSPAPKQSSLTCSDLEFCQDITDLLSKQANIIYFAGNSFDINRLLSNLPLDTKLPVMGGSALYQLGGYQGKNYKHLLFTAFAFPDEWNFPPQSTAIPTSVPTFLKTYPQLFAGSQPPGAYGYVRPDSDVLLANDALSTLLQGNLKASNDGTNPDFLPGDLTDILSSMSGPNAFQGFSGRISFGTDRFKKAVIVLRVTPDGFTQMDPPPYGCLQTSPCIITA